MLKKRQRLSRNEFASLLKQGTRLHGTTVSIAMIPASETKCGVVVSKKTARKAVARNKMRRSVYHALGERFNTLPRAHIAIFTRPQALEQTARALGDEIDMLIQEYEKRNRVNASADRAPRSSRTSNAVQ